MPSRIYNRSIMDGSINMFDMTKRYTSMKPDIESDRIFLQLTRGQLKGETIFRAQYMCKNVFYNYVKAMPTEAGMRGNGLNGYLFNQCLRSSMIGLLIEANYTDTSIILRTGHTNTNTLARYHNVQGAKGLKQKNEFVSSLWVMPWK